MKKWKEKRARELKALANMRRAFETESARLMALYGPTKSGPCSHSPSASSTASLSPMPRRSGGPIYEAIEQHRPTVEIDGDGHLTIITGD